MSTNRHGSNSLKTHGNRNAYLIFSRLALLVVAAIYTASDIAEAATEPTEPVATKETANFTPGERFARGKRFCSLGKQEEGIGEFRQLLKETPKNWLAHREIGKAYIALGNYSRAESSLSTALSINPKSSTCWLALASAQSKHGHLDSAEKSLEKAKEFADSPLSLKRIAKEKRALAALKLQRKSGAETISECPSQ